MRLSEDERAQYEEADETGLRLEIVAGKPYWEFGPTYEHQSRLARIATGVRRGPGAEAGCACLVAMAVALEFPDGSVLRPDISVFSREPERQGLVTLIPEAVVEIVSPRSREKDLKVSPPWYLDMGVKDVLVYDPFTEDVFHFRRDGARRFKTGRTVSLECGCLVDV